MAWLCLVWRGLAWLDVIFSVDACAPRSVGRGTHGSLLLFSSLRSPPRLMM